MPFLKETRAGQSLQEFILFFIGKSYRLRPTCRARARPGLPRYSQDEIQKPLSSHSDLKFFTGFAIEALIV